VNDIYGHCKHSKDCDLAIKYLLKKRSNLLKVKRLEKMMMKRGTPCVYEMAYVPTSVRIRYVPLYVQSFVTPVPLKVSQARLQHPSTPTSIRFKYVSVFHLHARRILYAHRFSSAYSIPSFVFSFKR